MPRTGRPPKPTRLKILSGNPGKRPLNDQEPRPAAGAPEPPDFLTGIALSKWHDLAPQLEAMGLLTRVDGDALAAYCLAWQELAEATVLLKDGRTVFGSEGSLKAHPAIAMQRSALQALRQFASLFGLSPSDRSRLKVDTAADDDPLGAFLKGAR